MRARSIKPGFFQNEDLIELPFEYRLLFAGLWAMSDREGRLEDRPKKIKLNIFPGDNVDCDAGLTALHERGFVRRYTHESKRFIQILNWFKHQRPHSKEAPSTIPAPTEHLPRSVPAPTKAEPGANLGNGKHALTPSSLTPSSLTPDSGLRTPDCLVLPSEAFVALKRNGAAVERVFEHWRAIWNHPDAKLDVKRRKRIEARLKDFTAEQLCDALCGFRNSSWHCGIDPKGNGTVYDKIDTLLRDSSQVEEGLRLFQHPPQAPPKPETAMERILRANSPDNSRVIDHDPKFRALKG